MKDVGYVLGQGCLVLLHLGFKLFVGIGYMLAVLIRPLLERSLGRWQRHRAAVRASADPCASAGTPQRCADAAAVAEPPPASARPDFEPADRIVSLRLDPQVGVINLRIFHERRVIKRDLIIWEPRLRALLKARRHSLPDVAYEPMQGLDAVKEESVRQAERLINERGNQGAPVPSRGLDRGRHDGPVTAADATGRPRQLPDPRPRPTVAAVAEHAQDVVALPQRRPMPAYVGRLVQAGSVMEHPPGRPAFEVFQATLTLDSGSELSLRGAELERELTACGCQVGERVEITPMGRVPVTLANGSEARKNLYRVRLAAQQGQE